MDPRIADYIRDNRRRYTKQALTDQLLEAGYSRDAIDATWAVLETPDRDATAGRGFWGRFWLFLIGANVVVFLGVLLLSGMLADLGGGGAILAVILAIALAIFALVAWGIVAITRPTTLSRGTALAIGAIVPLFLALLVGGTCYALVGGLGVGSRHAANAGTMRLTIDAPLLFDATGTGSCVPQPDGFSIYSDEVGRLDGRPVTVSLDVAKAPEAVDAQSSNLIIYLLSESPDQQEISFSSSPASQLTLDPNATALAGSLTFTDLAALEPIEPSAAPNSADQPISGTLAWQCD
jgi:hypothetical protein